MKLHHEAIETDKVLLPIMAKGLEYSSMPRRLRRFKCAKLRGTSHDLSGCWTSPADRHGA